MAGIISGVIMGSGLGYRISSILTSVAGTSMLLLLVLTMVVSLIMGMGVPTTAAYLVLASLVAPTMIQLGIPPLAAHMFIFYFGCISSITPPVALAAYAGAGLAGCDPNKTGYKAFRLAFCSFLMPYLFVYNPVLLRLRGLLLPLEPEVVRASAHDTGRCDADCARYGHRFGRYRHHRGGVCHRVHV